MVDDSFTVPYLDVDAIYALESAVRRLANLELFDSARLLSSAAATFEDNVSPLRGLVEQLAAMTRKASVAAEELQAAAYMAPDGSAWSSSMNAVTNRLELQANTLLNYEPPPLELDREGFW